MNEPNKNLGKFLFLVRTEKGLSLREFCEDLSISHAYLSKLEKGVDPRTGKDVTPTIETLTKIAAGINISLQDLLDRCGYFDVGEKVQITEKSTEKKEYGKGVKQVVALEDIVREIHELINSADVITYAGEQISKNSNIAELIACNLSKIVQIPDKE